MALKVTLAKDRYYLTADKTKAVKAGDPEAAFLLVAKGGAIAPEVARHYGIETYTGEAVERVAQTPEQERLGMVGRGTGIETAENYAEMQLRREVTQEVTSSVSTQGNRQAGRQAAMLADGIVAERRAEGAITPEGLREEAGRGIASPNSRTKEIAADGPGQSDSDQGSNPPGEGQVGLAPEQAANDAQELEDAKDKTL